MGWSELISLIQANYIEFLGTGGIGAGIIYLIWSKIQKSKEMKSIEKIVQTTLGVNTSSVKTIGDVGNLIISKFNEFNAIANKLIESNAVTQSENALLANMAIQFMALSNVPLDYKKEVFNALKSMSSLNDEIKKTLDKVLSAQSTQAVKVEIENQSVYDNLNAKGV